MSELRRFNLVSNGYDCYQVNNEIDRLEYHIQELNEKIMMYQKQVETVNNQFTMIKKRYQLLVSELSMREKQADDVARLALKEANSMIEDAKNIIDKAIKYGLAINFFTHQVCSKSQKGESDYNHLGSYYEAVTEILSYAKEKEKQGKIRIMSMYNISKELQL